MTKEECEIGTSKAIMEMRSRIAELEKENAGLKAGRPQWHDLRKNPNDLPESSIFHEVLNQNGTKMYYDNVLKNGICALMV